MEKKKMNFEIDLNKPIKIEITRGQIILLNHKDCPSVDYEYSLNNNIIPEFEIKKGEFNLITFHNSELTRINAIFYLPKNIKINAHIFNGNIIVNDLKNDINLHVDNGEIIIKNHEGKINATNFNGEININENKGELNLESINGAIKIKSWDSTGGNIHSNNGKIIIGLKKCLKDFDVLSNNGKIILGLEKNNPCTIIARGQDVIKYIEDKITGNSLGSPAKIDWEGGGIKIQAFSSSNKVIVTAYDNLQNISPDFDSFFNDFDFIIRENLNFESLAKGFKDFGGRIEKWGKKFTKNMQSVFSDINNKNGESKYENRKTGTSNERLEILKLLKEGKITVEEAEKLLKAL